MAGIYIHVPFCRKACHYCNFHFSTSLHRKPELLTALLQEITNEQLPAGIAPQRHIQTIYFGGGTPSLLQIDEIKSILNAVKTRFMVDENAEITLEANPDDITAPQLQAWKQLGINRLSIGVQSFFDEDLQWMNRAHNASHAINCINLAQQHGFTNLTIDLIYGTPTLTDEHWQYNVDKALELGVTHLSCYALTVEENTPLHHFIAKGKTPMVDEGRQNRQFMQLMNWMDEAGFEHYEISNFAKPGHRSRHNGNYWAGVPYYGFGPSAHSFDGQHTRWWNIANNALYIDKIAASEPIFEEEILTETQRLNERIMTSIRTVEGLPFDSLTHTVAGHKIDSRLFASFYRTLKGYEEKELLVINNGYLTLTKEGRFFADGIAADLFLSPQVNAD